MTVKYNKTQIFHFLDKESIGILGTIDKSTKEVRQRVMYYGLDAHFHCYLMSTKESPKINQILTTDIISFIVFGLEDPYDNSWEAEMNGHAELLHIKKDIDTALIHLKERNPFADVAIECGITRQFDFIKMKPNIIRFRVYGEALKGDPATILKLGK